MRALLTKSLIASLALLLAMSVFSGAAWAKTIFVNNATGNNATCVLAPFTTPCKTIAVAINTAALLAPGDTVQIFPGFYHETVTSTVTVPNVTIVGSGPSTIIDGSALVITAGGADVGTPVLSIQASNVRVASFTIQSFAVAAAFPTICGPTATTPAIAQFNPLIRVGSIATATLGVTISHVEMTANALDIAVCNSGFTQILSNNMHDNPAAAVSLAILQSNNVRVQSNTFANFPVVVTGTGVLLAGIAANVTQNVTISNNNFNGFGGTIHSDDIQISAFSGSVGNPITIDSNFFSVLTPGNGIDFPPGAPATVTGPITNIHITNNTFDGALGALPFGIWFNPALAADVISLTQIQGNQFRHLSDGIQFAPAAAAAVNTTTVTNNLFADNTTGDGTGIAFTTASTTTNNQFTRNVITRNLIGVSVTAVALAASINNFTLNNIEGNVTNGWSFTAAALAGTFLASNNWWGDSSGPLCAAAACNTVGGTGNSVVGAPVVPLGTTPVSPVPFATVFGTSLERVPAALSVSSIQAMGLGGFRPGLQVRVQGQGIAGVQLQVYDLSGRLVIDQSASGASLRWNGLSSSGQTLANGVYLYVVTVKGYDGKVINSEVRKLVILR